jgi:glycosyltransferase involved in cell wall biosynthesis
MNKELIIVNDQVNIIYQTQEPNIRIFNHKQRFKSLSAKRNFSIQQTSGEFIFITDDDDLYYPQYTEVLVKHHLTTDVDIVKLKYCVRTRGNKFRRIIVKAIGINNGSIRRSALIANPFNEKLTAAEDVELLSRLNAEVILNDICLSESRWGLDTYRTTNSDPDILTNTDKQKNIWNGIADRQRYRHPMIVNL